MSSSPRDRGLDRRELRRALAEVAPWLEDSDLGPRTVDAGTCPRCETLPALVPTCGPATWAALCASCAVAVGEDAWCDGHRDDAEAALAKVAALPARWPDLVVLFWVATGELDVEATPRASTELLPEPVRTALGPPPP